MLLSEIIGILEDWCPASDAEDFDNVGLLVGEQESEIKKAIITGITGHDGSYLTEFLLKKKYKVHGLIRRTSYEINSRIQHLIERNNKSQSLILHYGDLTDSSNLISIIKL